MRESRTYGSGRGACHEMHVPTATLHAPAFRPALEDENRRKLLRDLGFERTYRDWQASHGPSFSL